MHFALACYPHVFEGKFITVTRRDDGSLRPNFKPMKVDKDFSVYRYALGVFNELMWALEGCLTLKNVESKTTFKWRKLKNLTC